MFTRADVPHLSIAAATAVLAGVLFAAWAAPPSHLAEPVVRGEIQPIHGDDPNLARYKQVIAEQGGPGPLYVVSSYPPPAPEPAVPDEGALIEAAIARDAAELEARNRAWEDERSAWLEARRRAEHTAIRLPAAHEDSRVELDDDEAEPVSPPVEIAAPYWGERRPHPAPLWGESRPSSMP